jgi:hypothetical protein
MMTKKIFIVLATVVLFLGLLNPAQAYVMVIYQENVSLNPGLSFIIPEEHNPPPVVTTTTSSGNYFVSQAIDISEAGRTVAEGYATVSFNQSFGSGSTTFSLGLSGHIYGGYNYPHLLNPSGNVSVLFSIAKEAGDLQNTVPVWLEARLLPGYYYFGHSNSTMPIQGSASGPGCGVQGFCPDPYYHDPPNPTYDSEIVNLNVGDFYTIDLSFPDKFWAYSYTTASRRIAGDAYVTVHLPAVPLPPTLLLFGSGLLGLAGWRRFRKG